MFGTRSYLEPLENILALEAKEHAFRAVITSIALYLKQVSIISKLEEGRGFPGLVPLVE